MFAFSQHKLKVLVYLSEKLFKMNMLEGPLTAKIQVNGQHQTFRLLDRQTFEKGLFLQRGGPQHCCCELNPLSHSTPLSPIVPPDKALYVGQIRNQVSVLDSLSYHWGTDAPVLLFMNKMTLKAYLKLLYKLEKIFQNTFLPTKNKFLIFPLANRRFYTFLFKLFISVIILHHRVS